MKAGLVGVRPEGVLELLESRRATSGDGRARQDRRKLALIVEGGGMRGVLSAGSLLAIDLMGYRYCFDEIYGTSAGAVNTAYFLSGQGQLGITVYFDSISNRKFFNPLRLTKIVDVDFVYDRVVLQEKRLDEDALRSVTTDLLVSVTDAVTGENVLLRVKDHPEPVARLLKASSALPVLYNRTVEIGGRSFVDGGVTCSLPVHQAVERGCTDILVLLTKTSGYQVTPPTWKNKALFYLLLGRRYPELMRTYAELDAKNRSRRAALGETALEGVNVATICPTAGEVVVSRTTIDRELLVEGARRMAVRTYRLFGEESGALEEVFRRYRDGGAV